MVLKTYFRLQHRRLLQFKFKMQKPAMLQLQIGFGFYVEI